MPSNTKVRIKRATRNELWSVFEKYASVLENGELFMTDEDFAVKYLRLFPDFVYNRTSLDVLCGVVDSNKDNRINFNEFCAFEYRLCLPDALYRVLFNIFDYAGGGSISINEFTEVMSRTSFGDNLPKYMKVEKNFISNYFGEDGTKKIEYSDCCQFFHDFQESKASYSFKILDKDKNGLISHEDFCSVMRNHKNHLMTDKVRKKLDSLGGGKGGDVSYAYFKAFQLLLSNMETVKLVYLDASGGSRKAEIAKKDFLYSAQMISKITPMEVDVLYSLCDSTGKTINFTEIQEITPEHYMRQVTKRIVDIKLVEKPEDRTGYIEFLEVVYRFVVATIAGSLGVSPVYPSDLVKTRIINQRSGNVVYEGFFDCLRKTVKREGMVGLYRGLPLVMVFVPAEKAVKLVTNDFVCDKLTEYNGGKLPMWGEIVAGGLGGASQIAITNPLEMVKIRIQVAGEHLRNKTITAGSIISELGLSGLYKGFVPCLLRDIPFSMVYFPSYNYLKSRLADDMGYNSMFSVFTAGLIAATPAAVLTTPADMVKTRMQLKPLPGQTTYNGFMDAVMKIYREEGTGTFWRGAIARQIRSSPQFGLTLGAYELLQRWFFVDFGGSKPKGSQVYGGEELDGETRLSHHADHVGGYAVAAPIFKGIESKFGLVLPKYQTLL